MAVSQGKVQSLLVCARGGGVAYEGCRETRSAILGLLHYNFRELGWKPRSAVFDLIHYNLRETRSAIFSLLHYNFRALGWWLKSASLQHQEVKIRRLRSTPLQLQGNKI
ncbi:Phospho-N-acetylmuramoyl-pentapeptide-transferase [Gossypium arboreum]|uniref:Phospho-N-acetylmuramoyl-pentapeptide-transferase n=1 Tax=Gossypium arboreum TaxID=29729 RepID=A0A0B0PZ86_GOSAR|nr:Phospho-N-acetylmuramoyl-pentapeptide-transferase [Gossypium arboreum]